MKVKLKPGWKKVRFGDVVELSKERSSDPENDGFERFLGLEHMDPEDLKIRRWGDIVDGTTFTNVFRSGQVLFGKRRAYLRKVAIADFDGVCSGDIYVLQAKNNYLLPDLLPFICQSDSFFEHAIATSAGSLSPRTNWKSLAEYEFALPPIEEQNKLAKTFTLLSDVSQSYHNIYKRSRKLLESLVRYANYECAFKDKVNEIFAINTSSLGNNNMSNDEMLNYIDLSSITFPKGLVDMTPLKLSEAPSRARRIVKNGDILISTVRPNLLGHTIIDTDTDKPMIASTGFTVLTPRNAYFSWLYIGFFWSEDFIHYCNSNVSGSAYPAINAESIADYKVPSLRWFDNSSYSDLFIKSSQSVVSTWKQYEKISKDLMPQIRRELLDL